MSQVTPVPDWMHSVTPHIICDGAADAIEFYKKAFQAEEMMRLPTPDGKLMHAAIRIGNSTIMLADEYAECNSFGPKTLKGTPVVLHLQVENADEVFARAAEAGAKVVMSVQEMFWGDRYGQVEDPFGHRWSIATHVRDVSMEELQEASKAFLCEPSN